MPGGFDTRRPDLARVYDYYLGGKDNYGADRRAAEELEDPVSGYPGMRVMARANREFQVGAPNRDGAVKWLARNQGIRQFIDLGCGFPSHPSVHEAAREVTPDAAVAYVDIDPTVMGHVRALEATGPGLAAVFADVRDPVPVLRHPELRGVIDLGQPAAILLGGTLSCMSVMTARRTVQGFMAALAPGSAAVISCAHFADEALAGRISEIFAPGGYWENRTREDVESFFGAGGLAVQGKVGSVHSWPLHCDGQNGKALVIGGVGLKIDTGSNSSFELDPVRLDRT